jgi:hypothetical protein
MNALEVVRRVEMLGGRVVLEADGLRLRADVPLPDDLVAAVSREKVAIMLALGAPLNTAITSVLSELRPYLSPALRRLPDEKLIILFNFSFMAAFDKAVSNFSTPVKMSTR